jgi:hypothetical protein
MRGHVRHYTRIFSAVLIFVMGLLQSMSSCAQSLVEKFQIAKPLSHHIILLDTSGSMKPFYAEVLAAVQVLLNTLPKDDTLTVYRFDTYATLQCEGTISTLDVNQCLPASVNTTRGSKTEIGEAFHKVIDSIESSKAQIITIFFLTDGKEEPRADSDFARNHNAAWTQLGLRAKDVVKGMEIWGYGLGLKEYTDVGLLNRILPQDRVDVVSMRNTSELRSRLEGLVERVQRNWLKAAVQEELTKYHVELQSISEAKMSGLQVSQKFSIQSRYPHLDLGPVLINASSIGPAVSLTPSNSVAVPKKGASEPIVLSFHVLEPPASSKFGRSLIKGEVPVSWIVKATFEDADEIQRLGLDALPRIQADELTIQYAYEIGYPASFFISLGCLPLIAIMCAIWWLRLPRPRVYGKLKIGDANAQDLELFRKQEIRIGCAGSDITVPDVGGFFTLRVKRSGSWDTLYFRPGADKIYFEGRLESSHTELELKQKLVELRIDSVELLLTNVHQRPTPRRAWGKWAAALTAGGLVTAGCWFFGP